MIEDVFALAVAFDIERQDAEQPAARILGDQMDRLPAGARRDAARLLEGIQKGMGDKGIVVAGTAVPGIGRKVGDPVQRADGDLGRLCRLAHQDAERSSKMMLSAWAAARARSVGLRTVQLRMGSLRRRAAAVISEGRSRTS